MDPGHFGLGNENHRQMTLEVALARFVLPRSSISLATAAQAAVHGLVRQFWRSSAAHPEGFNNGMDLRLPIEGDEPDVEDIASVTCQSSHFFGAS